MCNIKLPHGTTCGPSGCYDMQNSFHTLHTQMVADLHGLLLNGPEKKRQYISVLMTALFNNTYYEMTGSSYVQTFQLYDESSRHST